MSLRGYRYKYSKLPKKNFNSKFIGFTTKGYSIAEFPSNLSYIDTITVDNNKFSWPDITKGLQNITSHKFKNATFNDGEQEYDVIKGNLKLKFELPKIESHNQKDNKSFVNLQLIIPPDLSLMTLIKDFNFEESPDIEFLSETDLVKRKIGALKRIEELRKNEAFILAVKNWLSQVLEIVKTINLPNKVTFFSQNKRRFVFNVQAIKENLVNTLSNIDLYKTSYNTPSVNNNRTVSFLGRRWKPFNLLLVFILAAMNKLVLISNQTSLVPLRAILQAESKLGLNFSSTILLKSIPLETTYDVYLYLC